MTGTNDRDYLKTNEQIVPWIDPASATVPCVQPPVGFHYEAEAVQELLNKGFAVVLFRDGLGGITALAAPPDPTRTHPNVNKAIKTWRDHGSTEAFEEVGGSKDEQMAMIQASIFVGPDKYTGEGVGKTAVAHALHSLTEKAVRTRLPGKREGEFFYPPAEHLDTIAAVDPYRDHI